MRLLVTRARGKVRTFGIEGVDVIQVPVLRAVPHLEGIGEIGETDYVIVMSELVVDVVKDYRSIIDSLTRAREIIGVGPSTCASLRKIGLPCVTPNTYSSRGVVDYIRGKPRGTVVVLRSMQGSPIVREELSRLGFSVVECRVYELVKDEVGVELALIAMRIADAVAFTSAMAYMALRGHVDGGKLLVAIGENTASVMRMDGYEPLVPREYTINGIIRLVQGFKR